MAILWESFFFFFFNATLKILESFIQALNSVEGV